jgi:hypothetical protein
LEENDKGVFLDFSMNFKKYDFFSQEYLKERSTRGIYDLVHGIPFKGATLISGKKENKSR